MFNKVLSLVLVLILTAGSEAVDALEIRVEGLFKGTAVLIIDGQQRLLKNGATSPEGVRLIEADARRAIVEVDGRQLELGLSRQIVSGYQEAEQQEITISRDLRNQYVTSAKFNGQAAQVLVDTGASTVAMSQQHAIQLGLVISDRAPQVRAITASGEARAVLVTIDTLDIDGLVVHGVQAMVIEGNYPSIILLGMTYLQHVSMREQQGVLYLRSKY